MLFKDSIELVNILTPGEECVALLIKDGPTSSEIIRFPTGTTFSFTINETEKTITASADPINN